VDFVSLVENLKKSGLNDAQAASRGFDAAPSLSDEDGVVRRHLRLRYTRQIQTVVAAVIESVVKLSASQGLGASVPFCEILPSSA
jgi:hypothetical protein